MILFNVCKQTPEERLHQAILLEAETLAARSKGGPNWNLLKEPEYISAGKESHD